MKQERITEGSLWSDPRGQLMKTPDEVAEMLRLRACGWGLKRIARQLGCSHHTVKDYVAAGGVKPFKSPERPKRLDGLEGWLRERLIRHRGNADVVRQEPVGRERRDSQPAYAATCRAALSPGAEGGGAGDDAV
nr:helix-turn-helix domain-containing protein [Bradyrhizobium sp. CCBAU 21359]